MLDMTLRHKLALCGGFTVRIEHVFCPVEYITSGYALSLHPDREVVIDAAEVTGDDMTLIMMGFVTENCDILATPNHYFGAWYDDETDKVYLDVSTIVDDETKALELAREHNQLAVFHLDTGREIRV